MDDETLLPIAWTPGRVLITGATGFVGRRLTATLVGQGIPVFAWHRPGSDVLGLRALEATPIEGDLFDEAALHSAFRRHDIDTVFHLAAHMGHHPAERAEQRRINVEAVRTVISASAGRRVVHMSSVAAIGLTDGGRVASDEGAPAQWPASFQYALSKAEGDRVARQLGAVVVNPATIYGPGRHGASAGRVKHYLKLAAVAGYPTGADTVVDVDDVVAGTLAAATRGKPGERYILGGDVVAFVDFLREGARLLGQKPPRRPFPRVLAHALGDGVGLAERLGIPVGVSSYAARVAALERRYSSDKARRTLGYQWRPWPEVLARALAED